MIRSSGPPDKTTPGNVGDIYQNTDNGGIFVCKDVKHRPVRQQFIEVSAKDINTEYVWDTTLTKFDDCTELFKNGKRLKYLDKLDFSGTTNMNSMFDGCSSLTTIPQMDTSNVTNMGSMFRGCSSLTTIPQMDTSNVTNMLYMFSRCTKLTTIPQMDTSNAIIMGAMFFGCSSLTTIPQMDTSNVTDMNSMFGDCTKLITIPQMDTSNVTDMGSMFDGCSSLTTIPQMDTSNVTNMSSMFKGCRNLTNLDLRNIKVNLQISNGTLYGHLLTVDSLVNTIKELVTQTSYFTLTMGTNNLKKIANLYCKIIDDTDPKKTMELCESTEEGAMRLTDYAQLKKWNIR